MMGDYNSLPLTQLQPGLSVQATDIYPAVDVTDTTQSPAGSVKKYTIQQLQDYIGVKTVNSNILSALVATTINLIAVYTNGVGGIGATLTNAGILSALVIDGISMAVGDRVLVWLQNTAYQNGVYSVTVIGDAGTRWILTRVGDYNGGVPGQIAQGDFIGITTGSSHGLEFFFMTSVTPLSVGVDDIIFQPSISVTPPIAEPWSVVTSSPQTMVMGNGYITNTAGLCTLILPASAVVGQKIQIQAKGSSLWHIQQSSLQQIFMGNVATTLGVSGYIQSIDLGSSITLVCTVANQEFYVLDAPQGSDFTII